MDITLNHLIKNYSGNINLIRTSSKLEATSLRKLSWYDSVVITTLVGLQIDFGLLDVVDGEWHHKFCPYTEK